MRSGGGCRAGQDVATRDDAPALPAETNVDLLLITGPLTVLAVPLATWAVLAFEAR